MNVMNNQRGYTWNGLKQQKEFGRKIALKLLNSPDNGDFHRNLSSDRNDAMKNMNPNENINVNADSNENGNASGNAGSASITSGSASVNVVGNSSGRDNRVACMLPSDAPILGSLLQEFLLSYGESA